MLFDNNVTTKKNVEPSFVQSKEDQDMLERSTKKRKTLTYQSEDYVGES